MATKNEINNWLKENKEYVWEDLNKFWEECCVVNWKCRMIKDNGKDWTSLPLHLIKQLPTLKETTLQKLKEKEDLERKQKLEELEEKTKKDYYETNFEHIMYNKILSLEKLTEKELCRLLDFEIESERYCSENRRWTRTIYSVIKLDNKYFMLEWEQGLTENQENSFYEQPYEVECVEMEKVIIVKEWKRI